MKRKLHFIAVAGCALLTACGEPARTKTESKSPASASTPDLEPREEVHPTLPSEEAITEGSLHDLESKWRDQNGRELALRDHFGGKVRVIAMGYSTCKFACPPLIADMRRIQDALDRETLGKNVGFAFVSIDPETDTPERLKEFEKEYKFDPSVWTLLTSDADSVLELAVVLGMKYRKTTVSDFAHSNLITVVGKDGQILHQQEGLGADPGGTIAVIKSQE